MSRRAPPKPGSSGGFAHFLDDDGAGHFGIACYRSLIAAAEDLGCPEIAVICEEILMEEEAMFEWIEDKIPEVTRLLLLQQTNAVR